MNKEIGRRDFLKAAVAGAAGLAAAGALGGAAFAEANEGEDKTVSFSGYSLSGTDLGNYSPYLRRGGKTAGDRYEESVRRRDALRPRHKRRCHTTLYHICPIQNRRGNLLCLVQGCRR